MSFREIGNRLGISHVAAWKRFEWLMESFRLEEAYVCRCAWEILRKSGEVEAFQPTEGNPTIMVNRYCGQGFQTRTI
jgi:hypothetical protein